LVLVKVSTCEGSISYEHLYDFCSSHIIYRCLQEVTLTPTPTPTPSPRWQNETSTHTKAVKESLCYFMKPFIKSTPLTLVISSRRLYWKISVQLITWIRSIYICLFQVWCHLICRNEVWCDYLETWASTQPHIAFWTLEFCSYFFVCRRTRTAPNSLPFPRPVCNLFSWLVDGACLLCLVVWGSGTLPPSGIRPFTSVSLNCWCDNFEPQGAGMIQLLRVLRSRRWRNSFFVHFLASLLVGEEFAFSQVCPHTPYVCCSLVLWLASRVFPCSSQKLSSPGGECMFVSIFLFCLSLITMAVKFPSP
jgi:hypothetical protein